MDEQQRQPDAGSEAEPQWLDNADFERLVAEVLSDMGPLLPRITDERVYENAGRGDAGTA